MKTLLGGIFGGKPGTRAALEQAFSHLCRGRAVKSEVWKELLTSADLDELLGAAWPIHELSASLAKHAQPAVELTSRCAEALEEALHTEEFGDEVELALSNAISIVTHLLSAGPRVPVTDQAKGCAHREGSHAFLEMLWAPAQGQNGARNARPLAERLIDATVALLFVEGFTVNPPEDLDEDGQKDAVGIKGVNMRLLWVDPEEGRPAKVSDAVREARKMGLQLLAALLCGGAPSAPPQVDGDDAEHFTTKEKVDFASRKALADLVPLIADKRALSYLCDPGNKINLRGELFLSMLLVALSYDPSGVVPYSGYFLGAEQEAVVHICLQLLGLLLLHGRHDVETDMSSAIITSKPQESVQNGGKEPLSDRGNFFHDVLSGISAERHTTFLVTGVVTLLGTLEQERSSYLPKSVRVPAFLCEVLVLTFHLAACPNFVAAVCREGEVDKLIEGIVHVTAQAHDHVDDDALVALIWSTMLRLTHHRDVSIELNEDFSGDVPDDLPDFSGSLADLVLIAAIKQASDSFLSTHVNALHHSIVEICLCTMVNVAVFCETMAAETCFRYFALLERCAKSVHSRRAGKKHARWLPYMLEFLDYSAQYHFQDNSHLMYGIMTRKAIFQKLKDIAEERTEKLAGGDSSLVPSTSGCDTPRSQSSEATDTTSLCEAQVGMWQQDLKQHLYPILRLMEKVLPGLEAEVERQSVTSPEDAKSLLPKTVLGLLPAPPVFIIRNVRDNVCTHRAAEHCIVACLAKGPLAPQWEMDETKSDKADAHSDAAASTPRRQINDDDGGAVEAVH